MIITKTPLRVSFVGGGSDLPWFFEEEPGACVSAAIDKYVYVTYSPKYEGTFRAAYSQMETVESLADLKHELIRQALLGHPDAWLGREIHSIADIPGGTGLGSSSAFTVGFLRALYPRASLRELAWRAISVEVDVCHKLIGYQDQFATAFGGVNLLEFIEHTPTQVTPIVCDYEALSAHCLLFDTGRRRKEDASEVIRSQNHDRESIRALAVLARDFAQQLALGDFLRCAVLMDNAWQVKRRLLNDFFIEDIYTAANRAGAWGGKLCGAGGGGFMLFMASPELHKAIKAALGLPCVPVCFGVEGTKVVYDSR